LFFAWDITMTADTKVTAPKEQILKLTTGVITRIEIKFARGCHGLVKVRLLHHESQLVPLSRGEWVTGDDEAVGFNEFFELKTTPYQLKFVACSPDTGYDHVVTVRVTVLPARVATMIPVIELLTRLLQRMGVIGVGA